MSDVKQLFDLQELDLEIATREKSLSEVRSRLADDSALTSARERVTALEADLDKIEGNRRALDSAVALLKERLQSVESRLYGGAVTNPKELAAAEEERTFVMGQQGQEEEKLLEVMVDVEDGQSAHREAIGALARIEKERPAELADLGVAEKSLSAELAELNDKRERITPVVPPRALSTYESLRKTKNGHAVAKVVGGTCQGCRLRLSTGQLQQARGSQGLVQCSICLRILYVV